MYLNKRLSSLLLPGFLFLLLGMFACEETPILTDRSSENDYKFVKLSESGARLGELKLPLGTEIWEKEINGQAQMKLIYPKGYELVVKDRKGAFQSYSETVASCACNEPRRPRGERNGTCNIVFDVGAGKVDCEPGNCNGDCLLMASGPHQQLGSVPLELRMDKALFINKSAGIDFQFVGNSENELKAASNLLLELPEVEKFIQLAQENLDQEAETRIVLLNVYGMELGIKVPENFLQQTKKKFKRPIVTASSFYEINCDCVREGETGCTKEVSKNKQKVRCISSCESCTMTIQQ